MKWYMTAVQARGVGRISIAMLLVLQPGRTEAQQSRPSGVTSAHWPADTQGAPASALSIVGATSGGVDSTTLPPAQSLSMDVAPARLPRALENAALPSAKTTGIVVVGTLVALTVVFYLFILLDRKS